MLGLMQDWPLLCHRIIDHAATYHAERPVISRSIEGPIHTTNYARDPQARACAWRSGSSATASSSATAWRRWPGIPGGISNAGTASSGIGAIYHTVNPRLFPDQIAWIINHAEDRVMMVDLTFLPILEKLADKLPSIERYVVLTDAAHMPATKLKNAVAYEDWIARGRRRFRMEDLRRKHRRRHVLHLGHHRQSQGRRLFAPLQRAAFDDGELRRRDGLRLARRRHAGGADVPRQLLGARLDRADAGRGAGHARRQDGRRLDLRIAQRLSRHLHRRGADGVADAAATSGADRQQAAPSRARGDRRLGLPARDDARNSRTITTCA